ncbi:MAG: MFS transporter [Bifidobacteriaceae bacterium]|jgi:MFS family permease|nr:MFS transporter [Bifidobacteriaceae bacterium]
MGRLFSKDFSLLVAGQLVSVVGSAIVRFALDLYVLDVTGRADVFALVLALSSLPGIVFTPVGGAIADRFSKRNLMVGLDAASAVVVAALIGVMAAGRAPLLLVGIVLALLSLVASMYQPTVQASVPALASEANLAQANGLVAGIGAVAALVGPVLGGVLYGLVGIDALLAVSFAAFACSAAFELFMRIPFTKRPASRGIVVTLADDVRQGLRFARCGNPLVMRIILLACALNMLAVPAFVIGVPYVLRFTLHSSDLMYGIGLGCTELATIVGALGAGRITRRFKVTAMNRPIWLFALLTIPMALAVTPAVLSLGYWPAFVLFFGFEMAAIIVATAMSVFAITEIQKAIPNDLLGKVMGVLLAGSQIAAPIGQMLYGLAFETFSGAVWIPLLLVTAFAALIGAAARTIFRSTPKKESGHDTSGLADQHRQGV